MRGLIFDIKHYSINDGPGIRTTVFFKGCPLKCWWCHNPESQARHEEIIVKERSLDGRQYKTEEVSGKWYDTDGLMKEIEKDRIYFDESGGGITFSGGEPLVQHEFLLEVLKELKGKGIHTALDTCGNIQENVLLRVTGYVDLFLYDLKIMDSQAHQKYTGVTNERILNNLRLLSEAENKVIIRFPVIPGITDTPDNIAAMHDFLLALPMLDQIDLLPYHRIAKNKYHRMKMDYKLEELEEPSSDRLSELKILFEGMGLKVTIGG